MPIFTVDEKGVLLLVLTEELDQMLNAVLFKAAAANPLRSLPCARAGEY